MMDSREIIAFSGIAEKEEAPSNSFPEYTMFCHSCQHEFKQETSEEEVEKTLCPLCQSSDVKNLYISFPEDGPGFKNPKSFYGFGGCD